MSTYMSMRLFRNRFLCYFLNLNAAATVTMFESCHVLCLLSLTKLIPCVEALPTSRIIKSDCFVTNVMLVSRK